MVKLIVASTLMICFLLQIPSSGGKNCSEAVRKKQATILESFSSETKYNNVAKEQCIREEAIAKWIACSGLPSRTVEDEDFCAMIQIFDKKFNIPKKRKISNLAGKLFEEEKQK